MARRIPLSAIARTAGTQKPSLYDVYIGSSSLEITDNAGWDDMMVRDSYIPCPIHLLILTDWGSYSPYRSGVSTPGLKIQPILHPCTMTLAFLSGRRSQHSLRCPPVHKRRQTGGRNLWRKTTRVFRISRSESPRSMCGMVCRQMCRAALSKPQMYFHDNIVVVFCDKGILLPSERCVLVLVFLRHWVPVVSKFPVKMLANIRCTIYVPYNGVVIEFELRTCKYFLHAMFAIHRHSNRGRVD